MMQRDTNRIYFIDYLRGFMVLLVVLDHSMHAYAPHFKKSWYFQDFGGKALFDVLHMHNDVIMMPMLFFLAGIFVLPSLERRGVFSFAKEKMYRLFIPFIIGVPLLVPPQTYLSGLAKGKINEGYVDYVFQTFFWDELWSSAFWFLLTLMVLTAVLVMIKYLCPMIITGLGKFAKWVIENPIKGVFTLCLYAVVMIGFSEIAFGRFDFNMSKYLGLIGKLMKVRQSRFIMEFSFFFFGAGFAQAGIYRSQKQLSKMGKAWVKWTVLAVVSGGAYIAYSLTNFYEGAYALEILRHFYFGGSWGDAWPLIQEYGGPILIRTSFMGVFMIALAGMYMALFQKFLDKAIPSWQSLATCSFGIYIFHEPIVCAVHYYFFEQDVSVYVKFLTASLLATSVSWALTHTLRTLPGFKKVL